MLTCCLCRFLISINPFPPSFRNVILRIVDFGSRLLYLVSIAVCCPLYFLELCGKPFKNSDKWKKQTRHSQCGFCNCQVFWLLHSLILKILVIGRIQRRGTFQVVGPVVNLTCWSIFNPFSDISGYSKKNCFLEMFMQVFIKSQQFDVL